MFKKLIGSISKDGLVARPAKMEYTIPDKMPNLNPDLNAMLPKIKLPDSVKKHIADPALAAADAEKSAVPEVGEVAADVATEAAVGALDSAGTEDAGQVLATAVEDANGESAPFLAAILSDPRFAVIGVNFLALGLKKETAILWAVECTSLGYAIANEQNKEATPIEMSPEEELALDRAKAYVNGEDVPAEELSELAAEAGLNKPGAVVAQAAAWDKSPPPPEAGSPDILVGDMVANAVLLSAALALPEADKPKPPDATETAEPPPVEHVESASTVQEDPAEAESVARKMKPFIDKGLELAAAG